MEQEKYLLIFNLVNSDMNICSAMMHKVNDSSSILWISVLNKLDVNMLPKVHIKNVSNFLNF